MYTVQVRRLKLPAAVQAILNSKVTSTLSLVLESGTAILALSIYLDENLIRSSAASVFTYVRWTAYIRLYQAAKMIFCSLYYIFSFWLWLEPRRRTQLGSSQLKLRVDFGHHQRKGNGAKMTSNKDCTGCFIPSWASTYNTCIDPFCKTITKQM